MDHNEHTCLSQYTFTSTNKREHQILMAASTAYVMAVQIKPIYSLLTTSMHFYLLKSVRRAENTGSRDVLDQGNAQLGVNSVVKPYLR